MPSQIKLGRFGGSNHKNKKNCKRGALLHLANLGLPGLKEPLCPPLEEKKQRDQASVSAPLACFQLIKFIERRFVGRQEWGPPPQPRSFKIEINQGRGRNHVGGGSDGHAVVAAGPAGSSPPHPQVASSVTRADPGPSDLRNRGRFGCAPLSYCHDPHHSRI